MIQVIQVIQAIQVKVPLFQNNLEGKVSRLKISPVLIFTGSEMEKLALCLAHVPSAPTPSLRSKHNERLDGFTSGPFCTYTVKYTYLHICINTYTNLTYVLTVYKLLYNLIFP